MRINKQRHILLKLLSEQYIEADLKELNIVGVYNDVILKNLKCTEERLRLIASLLYELDEITYYQPREEKGICITEKGLSAYSTKKYLLEDERIIFDRIKNWVQTTIPVMSLIITIIIYCNSESKLADTKKELQIVKDKLELIEKNETRIQLNSKNQNHIETIQKDTLKK